MLLVDRETARSQESQPSGVEDHKMKTKCEGMVCKVKQDALRVGSDGTKVVASIGHSSVTCRFPPGPVIEVALLPGPQRPVVMRVVLNHGGPFADQ